MVDVGLANWIVVSQSQFRWEREALAFIRTGWPKHEPHRAWANFEFVAHDGISVNEADLLVLKPSWFFLVEIKGRPGGVTNDARTRTKADERGRTTESESPLLLANGKAKRLDAASACRRWWVDHAMPPPLPRLWAEAVQRPADNDVATPSGGRP